MLKSQTEEGWLGGSRKQTREAVGSLEGGGEVARRLEREQVLVSVDIGQGGEGVFPMLEHVLGVAGGESACLRAQVEEDGISFPSSKGTDGCLIDSGYEQGGGSPGVGAVGCDLGWRDVGDVFDISSSGE